MSGVHKYPTISFRISPREREEIEAKILASGLLRKIILSVLAFITGCAWSVKKNWFTSW